MPNEDSTPGIEPRPSLRISHLTILRNDAVSLLCLPNGEFDSTNDPAAGLYFSDCRYLSRLELRLGGAMLTTLDSNEGGFSLACTLTNPDFADAQGKLVPAQAVMLRRERAIGPGLAEHIVLTNYARSPLDSELQIRFAADFADMFVVRGFERRSVPPPVTAVVGESSVEFSYPGLDGINRSATVRFEPAPASLKASEAVFDVRLRPGEEFWLEISVAIDGAKAPGVAAIMQRTVTDRADFKASSTWFESSHPALDRLYSRSVEDIHSLITPRGDYRFVAAGVPWFDALFGRDSLIAGMALLRVSPDLLRDSLVLLAESQAGDRNPERDAAPGKIAHEIRAGELANIGEVPFGCYYGSIDSTPLFVMACREYMRWTGDVEQVKRLMPAIHRAVNWMLGEIAADGLGTLAYQRRSSGGLEHQGWKDSEDGVCHPDGAPVGPPVALIEVQAYVAAALAAYHELCTATNERPASDTSTVLKRTGQLLSREFLKGAVSVLALEGDGTPVNTVASNCGHVLWVGACGPAGARKIQRTLLGGALFSGWGLRTLAAGQPAFNPLGYHVGSVWPHDNAMILEGLRRYGFLDDVERIGTALLEAMLAFHDGRVPELFCGDSRDARVAPTPYPVASRPQAWSAASLAWTLFTLLGVTASDASSLHIVHPLLPSWLEWVRLRNLRFGETSVDLFFKRDRSHTAVEVERHAGPGSVVLGSQWPVPPVFASR